MPLVFLGDLGDLSRITGEFVQELADRSGLEFVHAALAGISPLLREVAVRHYFKEESVATMAASLGVSEGTIMSRLHNAREVLHGLLSEGSGCKTKSGGARRFCSRLGKMTRRNAK